MVRGAENGRVSCCSTSAARASDHVEGPSPAIDFAVCVNVCNREDPPERRRRGRFQIAPTSGLCGSVDSERCISFTAETPSIRAW
jgi:hypothetical protein